MSHQPKAVRLPGRLLWRDSGGALRFVAVETRDVSEVDIFVECQMPVSIPPYRFVSFQIEPSTHTDTDLPRVTAQGTQRRHRGHALGTGLALRPVPLQPVPRQLKGRSRAVERADRAPRRYCALEPSHERGTRVTGVPASE